jgi:hypothetical protein
VAFVLGLALGARLGAVLALVLVAGAADREAADVTGGEELAVVPTPSPQIWHTWAPPCFADFFACAHTKKGEENNAFRVQTGPQMNPNEENTTRFPTTTHRTGHQSERGLHDRTPAGSPHPAWAPCNRAHSPEPAPSHPPRGEPASDDARGGEQRVHRSSSRKIKRAGGLWSARRRGRGDD